MARIMKLPVWFVAYALAFYCLAIAALMMLFSVSLSSRVYAIVVATVGYMVIGLLLKFRKTGDVAKFMSFFLPALAAVSGIYALLGVVACWQSLCNANFTEHPALGPLMSIGYGTLAIYGVIVKWKARKVS